LRSNKFKSSKRHIRNLLGSTRRKATRKRQIRLNLPAAAVLHMMDHVPEINEATWAPVKVPCLSREPFDGLAFGSYPARRGWERVLLLRGNFTQHPPAKTAAFLQDWLYFGVLHEILGGQGSKANYVMQAEQTQELFVTTRDLNQHLDIEIERIRMLLKVDASSGAAEIHRIEQCLKQLSTFCTSVSSATTKQEWGARYIWPLPPEIDLSIRILGQHISSVIYTVSFFEGLSSILPLLSFGSPNFSKARMLQSGWCSSDVALLAGQTSATTQYYASMLHRDQSLKDHSKCSEHTCFANQVDEGDYQTRHVETTCDCRHITSSVEKIVEIINGGGIPLIETFVPKDTETIELKTTRFRPGMQYIALSHVWSDGMGNVSSNSLPKCQLSKLKSTLNELDSLTGTWMSSLNTFHLHHSWKQFMGRSPYFWLDTLCIPVGKYEAQRKRAITMMGQIYNKAQRVLVLDAELQQLSMMSSNNEIFLRLALSGWMRRLWTLQEAVMARQLHIKLSDGYFNLQGDIEAISKKSGGLSGSPSSDIRSFYWEMRSLRKHLTEKRQRKFFGTFHQIIPDDPIAAANSHRCFAILLAFTASTYRLTSKPEDDLWCLASLLEWDVACLSNIPVKDRMRTLLSQQSMLPQGLLFFPGQKMTKPGWRWALQTFGNNGTRHVKVATFDASPGRRDDGGLFVEYPGFIFVQPVDSLSNKKEFVLEVQDFDCKGSWLFWVTGLEGALTKETTPYNKNSHLNATLANCDHRGDDMPLFGIILQNRENRKDIGIPIPAILVDIQCENFAMSEEIITCAYKCLVEVRILGPKEEALSIVLGDPVAAITSLMAQTSNTRKWCVG